MSRARCCDRTPRLRHGSTAGAPRAPSAGIPRTARGAAVQGRPVESDLPALRRRRRNRDAQQAGPAAKLLPSAHAIDREFRVMRRCRAGIPVPRTLLLVEDESVIGRAFYVMEHVEGRVLWEQSLPGMSNAERAAIYDEMNRVIARAAHGRLSRRSASRTTASPATTSSARSAAGASSTAPRRPRRSRRWTG